MREDLDSTNKNIFSRSPSQNNSSAQIRDGLDRPLRPFSNDPSQAHALNRPALRLLLGPDVVLHGGGDVLVAGVWVSPYPRVHDSRFSLRSLVLGIDLLATRGRPNKSPFVASAGGFLWTIWLVSCWWDGPTYAPLIHCGIRLSMDRS